MKHILTFTVVLLIIATSSWAKDKNGVTVDVLSKTTKSWDGTELLTYPEGIPEITILKITIPPNVKLSWHKHLVINAGIMLTGELSVITRDNEKLVLKAGDAIVEVVNKWHHGINEGPDPVEIVVFYAGVLDEPLSIKAP